MSLFKCIALLVVIADLSATRVNADEQALDLIIQGGRIVDGTGSPWYVADVGIRNGKITKIGRIDAKSARRVIDAEGLIVAPGFIDMMGQTATPMLRDPSDGHQSADAGDHDNQCRRRILGAPRSSQMLNRWAGGRWPSTFSCWN